MVQLTLPPAVPLSLSLMLLKELAYSVLFSFRVRRQLIYLTQANRPIDFHHLDLLAHFDRERIPERVVCSLSHLSTGSCHRTHFRHR